MEDPKIYSQPFERHGYDAPYWFSKTYPGGRLITMVHPSLESAVARVRRATSNGKWEMWKATAWKIFGTETRISPSNQRDKVSAYLARRPSKMTNSRRKAMIQHWNLNPETTWPELMDVLSTQDEMIFQMKLATLREKYATKPS